MGAPTVPLLRLCAPLLLGAGAAAIVSLSSLAGAQEPRAERVLRIVALVPPGEAALRDGLVFGAEEAARSARLFGWRVEVSMLDPQAAGNASGAEGGSHALVIAGSDTLCRMYAGQADIPTITVACGADDVRARRAASCESHVFHVSPSDAMRSAALAAAADGGPGVRTVAWDSTLERFGAAQVNDRFRARFGRGAAESEWAAWLAVKVLAESAMRARSTAPRSLRAQLAAATIDGHKGLPLSFRAWDGQLRQPLYVIGESPAQRAPREVPARRQGVPARELLDAIGGARALVGCTEEAPR